MNIGKYALCISLFLFGHNLTGMDKPSKRMKLDAAQQQQLNNAIQQALVNHNMEVTEAAAQIEDNAQREAFLNLAYSEETYQKVIAQAKTEFAASQLMPSTMHNTNGIQHTSPQKPKPSKTLPSKKRQYNPS
jgi:hypothetical protein